MRVVFIGFFFLSFFFFRPLCALATIVVPSIHFRLVFVRTRVRVYFRSPMPWLPRHDRSEIYRSGYKNFGLPRRHRPLVHVTPRVMETQRGPSLASQRCASFEYSFLFFVLVALHRTRRTVRSPIGLVHPLVVAFVSFEKTFIYTPAINRRSCRSRECPLK